jgi:AcrR family transcriptional regulator
MPGLRELKKEDKKERLLKGAMELFTKKGFEKTSIEDITINAKVAKGTFYNFFDKKEDVIRYFLDNEISNSRREIERKLVLKDNIIDQLELLIFTYLKNIFKNKDFSRVLIRERIGKIGVVSHRNEIKLMQSISQLIDMAKERNEIKNQVDSRHMAEMIFAMYTMYAVYWLNGFIKTKRQCVVRIREVLHLVFDGVGTNNR